MAFSVQFCYTSDPPNTLVKTFGESTQVRICTPYEPLSDINGKIIIDYDEGIEGYNYAVIYDGGSEEHPQHEGRPRSCFITDIEKLPGGKMAVYVHVDVLETYKADIKSSPIYVTRAEQQATEDNPCGYNTYIHDAQIRKTAKEFTIVKVDPNIPKFEYPDPRYPDTKAYILGVIG